MRQAMVLGFVLMIPTAGALADGVETAMIVAPGSRVRVTRSQPESKRLVGTIVSEDEASLTLDIDGRHQKVTVPRNAVARLERSAGDGANVDEEPAEAPSREA